MNEFQIMRDIECPAEEVFAALINFDRIPDWNPGVIEVRWTKDAPIQVGSTMVWVGEFLGRVSESDSQVTVFEPGTKFCSKSVSGPFFLEIENTLATLDGGTRITSTFRGESRGFFKIAEPVMVRLSRNLFETAMDNFKALLESHALS
jgi:hypothetical protein